MTIADINKTLDINHTVIERFLNYVTIDTQSDPNSKTFPSTAKQKNLGKILVQELLDAGVKDAHMDKYGYVYGTLPATTKKKVPVICFCSHMDTSPDCSGKNVKPLIHRDYRGKDIVLPDDPTQVITMKEHPSLRNQFGNDVITASGTTLLGADNKAGLAAIMDAVHYLMRHPHVAHGDIKILFTPDEEIGQGVKYVDMEKLGADFGYTVDGEELGSIEDETFSADGVELTIHGVSAHPGFAKGKMESAIKIVGEILAKLPKKYLSPESTEEKEGFVHPTSISGTVETAKINFIVRDFEDENLIKHEDALRDIANEVLKNYPKSRMDFKVKEQYRNMKKILKDYPQVVEYAIEAMDRAGIRPLKGHIRGGTDGSRLSYMGLPCPNLFAGEHAFHSKHEWVSVQDMEKAAKTIVHLVRIWAEK